MTRPLSAGLHADLRKLAQRRPVQLSEVQWYVVTEDNLDEFLDRFEKENGPVAFMAVSVRGYENLALNTEELRRFIKQQNEILVYYESMASEPQDVP